MLCKCRRDLGHHLDHHYLLPPHSSYYVELNSPFYGYGYDVNNIGNYTFFYYYFWKFGRDGAKSKVREGVLLKMRKCANVRSCIKAFHH
jgi:hypothetical protein